MRSRRRACPVLPVPLTLLFLSFFFFSSLRYDSIYKTDATTTMIKKGILKAVTTMITLKDSYLNFYCASILCNLVCDKSTHETLVSSGILASLDRLTLESAEAETKVSRSEGEGGSGLGERKKPNPPPSVFHDN